MAEALDEIADRLYAAPPEGFVAARDEAVARARAGGDVAAARWIAALRRPTIAAWLVNLLALRRPDLVTELTELAAALRVAQRELRGAELRELSAQRRAAVSALVVQARELAAAADPRVDPARLPVAEVEATLNAALSDVEVAAVLTAGRLVRAVAYAGFGEVPRPQLRLVTGERAGTRTGTPATGTGAGGKAVGEPAARPGEPAGGSAPPAEPEIDRAALRKELTAARTAQKRADTDLERAAAAERDGARAVAAIEAEQAELERRRAAADQELGRRKLARKAAERAAAVARRRVGDAQAAVEATDTDGGIATGRADRKRVRGAQSGA